MARGKWMVRVWRSGKVSEMSKFWVAANQKPRTSKTERSDPGKTAANAAQAVKHLARLISTNFAEQDFLLTCKYDAAGMERIGGDREAAEKQMMLFVQRCGGRYKRRRETFRAIAMTSETSSAQPDKPARMHHHLIVSGGLISKREGEACYRLAGTPIDEIWGNGTVDLQQLRREDDRTGLAVYLVRQASKIQNARRWHATRNLMQPEFVDVPLDRASIADYNRHKRRGMPALRVDADGALLVPPKCVTLENGGYVSAIGAHYIRFLLPEYRRAAPPKQPPKQPRKKPQKKPKGKKTGKPPTGGETNGL